MSENSRTGRVIGIDLGTTNCAMAYLDRDGQPVTIPNAEGHAITPSVVRFDPSGEEVVVGQAAKLARHAERDRIAECVKRDMGERYYHRRIIGKWLSPQAISALILKKLKQDAEAAIGALGGVVITVPAYFNETRRQATVAAGQMAALEVLDIINEPTSAALAFAYQGLLGGRLGQAPRLAEGQVDAGDIIVVYDLGGGTFDVTVLKIQGEQLTVLATDGDVHLGGREWDLRIIHHVAELFMKAHGTDLRQDPASVWQLLPIAEQAKRNLSRQSWTTVTVTHARQTMTIELTQDDFETITADLLYRTESRLNRVITAAGVMWGQVAQVLTVGGSTRMPQVIDMLQRVTGKKPNTSLAPDEVVAHGAAIHAAIHVVQKRSSLKALDQRVHAPSPTDQVLRSVSAARIVEPTDEDLVRSTNGTAAPQRTSQTEQVEDGLVLLDDQELNLTEDPEEARTQRPWSNLWASETDDAADSAHDRKTQLLDDTGELPLDFDPTTKKVLKSVKTVNVNAHSLGVILKMTGQERVNSVLIPRNTQLPTSVTRRYGTVAANQTAVSVIVVEGESEHAEECTPIGSCRINPLPWGLRKGSTIYVTFSYDASGRLDVKAVEATTGNSANTMIRRDLDINAQTIDRTRKIISNTKVT